MTLFKAAHLKEKKSGVSMEVYTSFPGLYFNSGNDIGLNNKYYKDNKFYGQY